MMKRIFVESYLFNFLVKNLSFNEDLEEMAALRDHEGFAPLEVALAYFRVYLIVLVACCFQCSLFIVPSLDSLPVG